MTAHASRRVMLAIAACAVAASCTRTVRSNGWNVLLITYETTRADHVGAYGYGRDTTPRLDALASKGVLFENAITASPRTNPSLASLMTSQYPQVHGVRNLLLPLEPENRTLAEVLRDAGYRTHAVQTHPRLVRHSGFEQGFESYDDDYAAHPLAEQACASVVEWIGRQRGTRPWFVWLHLMDPHWTYDPPPAWRESFAPEHPLPAEVYRKLRDREITIGPLIYQNRMSPEEVAGFVNLYDAELRYTDHALGALLDGLEALGALERTLVVVSADHGESLGENHYFFEHGAYGGQAEIRVPLVLYAGGRLPEGVRVPATVRNIDVAPTIVEFVEAGHEPAFGGVPLQPLVGGEGGDRSCFGETDQVFHDEFAAREVEGVLGKWRWLQRGRFKLVHRPKRDAAPERVLYDLDSPEGETADVRESHPEVFAALAREMDALLAGDVRPAREYHITEEARDILRSLGYVN